MLNRKSLGKKSLKSEKRIVSGMKKRDTMRFVMESFTSVSTKIEFLPSFFCLEKKSKLLRGHGL